MTGAWPRGLDYDPDAHAAALGLTVQPVPDMAESTRWHEHRLGVRFRGEHRTTRGRYWHDLGLIEVRADLMPRTRRATVAHEVAHAIYGHWSLAPGYDADEAEHQAITWSTHQLIDPTQYAAALLLWSDNGLSTTVRNIALDLHVSDLTIRDYRQLTANAQSIA